MEKEFCNVIFPYICNARHCILELITVKDISQLGL